jgi:hypothetical protein
VAEELDFSRTRGCEGEFHGVISLRKLYQFGDAKRHLDAGAVEDVLEVDEMPWAVSGRRNAASSSVPIATMV